MAFPPPGKGDYRGTLQPLTAFDPVLQEGVVFFTGTRFNPVSSGRCVSSFDTIIFGLIADTGAAAYATTEYSDTKAIGLGGLPKPGPSGTKPFDQGTSTGGASPSPFPIESKSPGNKAVVRTTSMRPASTVCR